MVKMKKYLFVVFMVILSSVSTASIWTEDFSGGYGRLDHTSDNGNSYITYNSTYECLDGIFYRSSNRDFRYASLDDTLNGASDNLGFSAVITPISSNGTSGNHGAVVVGFLNSSTWDRVSVTFNYSPNKGNRIFLSYSYESETKNSDDISFLNFDFGKTYFIDAYLNAETSVFSADVYEGIDEKGIFQGNISYAVQGDSFVDALGCGNAERGGVSDYYFDAKINEVSLTVPEPVTISMFALGGIILRRRTK